MTILGVVVAGLIVGALARLFMPGKERVGILVTIAIGIIGTLVGWWLAGELGVQHTSGIDWVRWIISIALAMALLALAGSLGGRRRGSLI